MKNKINASELQRKGIKQVYEMLDEYTYFTIENQREDKQLYISKRKDNVASIIQTIRHYKNDLNKLGVNGVTIFGSTARGEATSRSDIDLLLDVSEEIDLLDFAKIKDQVLKTLKIKDLDIHNRRFIKSKVLEAANKEGILAF